MTRHMAGVLNDNREDSPCKLYQQIVSYCISRGKDNIMSHAAEDTNKGM